MTDRQQQLKQGEMDLSARLSEAEAERIRFEQLNQRLSSEVDKREQMIKQLTAEVQKRDQAIADHNLMATQLENVRVSQERENQELRATIEGLNQHTAAGGTTESNLSNGEGLNPADQATGAASESFRLLSNTMTDLCNEMKVAQGGSLVQPFSGEGHSQFSTWVKEMERTKLRINGTDERMRSLALATLKGAAADFLVRLLKNDPRLSWKEILHKLKGRYCDLADARYAKQQLRALEQTKTESVQNFSERVYLAAQEAFPGQDLDEDATLQSILIDVLVNGLRSVSITRHLIRTNPRTFREAVNNAAQEQQTLRSIKLQQATKRAEEPMEVDHNDLEFLVQPSRRPDSLEGQVTEIAESVRQLVRRQDELERSAQVGKGNKKRPKTDKDGHFICYQCNKPGHIARNCKQSRRRDTETHGSSGGAADRESRPAPANPQGALN